VAYKLRYGAGWRKKGELLWGDGPSKTTEKIPHREGKNKQRVTNQIKKRIPAKPKLKREDRRTEGNVKGPKGKGTQLKKRAGKKKKVPKKN